MLTKHKRNACTRELPHVCAWSTVARRVPPIGIVASGLRHKLDALIYTFAARRYGGQCAARGGSTRNRVLDRGERAHGVLGCHSDRRAVGRRGSMGVVGPNACRRVRVRSRCSTINSGPQEAATPDRPVPAARGGQVDRHRALHREPLNYVRPDPKRRDGLPVSLTGEGEENHAWRAVDGHAAAWQGGVARGDRRGLSAVRACRELWRQARSKKVRAAFPKYTVDMEEREDGAPAVVKVSFVNGKSVSIGAQDKTLLDLFDVMLEHTAELEEADEIQEMEKN